ncbi:succinylglutamate desuccinylase/aspartoacylase family protein [Paracoccus sp. MKU1]|uniref:succinylglutamate desuccinylase/aspartoacylase domain-containing protein n=1 Tax=Paracoccus sp. MKU1 TaxID=1745182 RepID=UPI0007190A99|nr:succinylglutamate desuccinylase/aspartoacylase family protein [Paracoccus sp. MKU1]KRW96959.1 hypothetical protein AQY21_06285 [Paracoccus sp. MKU1]
MNRVFPGATGQGPTRALAGFLNRHLLPRAGLVIDLHSGGGTTNYLDAAYLTLTGDPAQDRRGAALARAFGLPWTMVVGLGSIGGDLDGAALAAGCAMISCELGGMCSLMTLSMITLSSPASRHSRRGNNRAVTQHLAIVGSSTSPTLESEEDRKTVRGTIFPDERAEGAASAARSGRSIACLACS